MPKTFKYTNKTNKLIPYCCTDFSGYSNNETLKQDNYIQGVESLGGDFAAVSAWGMVYFFQKADFLKLTKTAQK